MNIDIYFAVAGFLMMLCVFTNRVSDRFGIPSLLFFLALGMLAGVDGPGGINFQDSTLTNYVGTLALIFILFNGGLQTNWNNVRPIIVRGSVLSTLGVALTAAFLFVCTHHIIGLPFETALLLSMIVSSTDAPAVFNILRTSQITISSPNKSLLEFESASNDPMAVLLTLAALSIITEPSLNWNNIVSFFIRQMFSGIIFGLALGRVFVHILQNVRIPYQGLYPVYGVSSAFLIYSLTQLAGGSGILAVYIGGIVMGNYPFLHRRNLIRFNDSLAWIMQISMFLILGLLVNPHELPSVMLLGLTCSVFLMFVSRPLAVFICLWGSSYTLKDRILISWAGLKGAVPIILATYPLTRNIANAPYIFNLIFFLVIISVLFQGKTLPWLAEYLGKKSSPELKKENKPLTPKRENKK